MGIKANILPCGEIIVNEEKVEKTLFEEFLSYGKVRNHKPRDAATIRGYRTYVEPFVKKFGEANIRQDNIDAIENSINDYIAEPNKKTGAPVSDRTYNVKVAYLKAFFRYCIIKKKIITTDPMREIYKRTTKPRQLEIPTEKIQEVGDYLKYRYAESQKTNDLRDYLAYIIMASVGTRSGETGAFGRMDLRVDCGRLIIRLDEKITKSNETRDIPVPFYQLSKRGGVNGASEFQKLFDLYYDWHAKRFPAPETPFFCTTDGKAMTSDSWYNQFARLIKKVVNKKAYVHDMRRFAITNLLTHGADIKTVADIAGHKEISTTNKYLNPVKAETFSRALSAIDNANVFSEKEKSKKKLIPA